ncbi:OsmC family peroxiredoxin [Leptospira wolffii]|uniref:Peroxiredoxin n=1 Tax=Leptospira wolffii TaxID=409998 RepID=A0A2M9Z802_9LEPT|nr:OsmC family protein [Leptospira wolffii]PJZ64514.1 peroxiredoxin [Leptospira wolffii]TGK55239.1 OsmC family peroxiredoxin [Leptospira wolffii]TGK65748.1 OsmC family peroxiredoxin [Leptospira wolffii]TGK70460.1 OsmC family peroxiredoxin [Leptospira wolffii]TGL30004.1 OsmC family peroxiredoxin [Leptospira wolffii]
MANTVFESKATWAGGLKLNLQSRHHKWVVDEPEILGGTDEGANPVEYLLGGLASCLGVLVSLYAPAHDVILKDFQIYVDGDLDLDGFQELAPVRPGFSEIRYRIDIQTDSPSSNVDALLKHIDRICPVKDSLQGVSVLAQNSLAAK